MRSGAKTKHSIFFFSDMDGQEIKKIGFRQSKCTAVISSNHKTLSVDVRNHKPGALVIDMDFCRRKSLKVRPFLHSIKKEMMNLLIFLTKSAQIEFEDLIATGIIYSVSIEIPEAEKLFDSVEAFHDQSTKPKDQPEIRREVSFPCLLKKIGCSGLVSATIVDLSSGGMKVKIEGSIEHWETGDEIRYSIIKNPTDTSSHVHGLAKVRWRKAHTENESAIHLGLMFHGVPPNAITEKSTLDGAKTELAS